MGGTIILAINSNPPSTSRVKLGRIRAPAIFCRRDALVGPLPTGFFNIYIK
jgi:hypothetical protein